MRYNKQVIIYNAINIITVITSGLTYFLVFTIWRADIAHALDEDPILVIYIFVPLIIMIVILLLNDKVMHQYVHLKNEEFYLANNIELDELNTGQYIPKEAINSLPTCNISNRSRAYLATKILHGKLEDISLEYYIDKIRYQVKGGDGKKTKIYHDFSGFAITYNFENIDFGDTWTLYKNKNYLVYNIQVSQENKLYLNKKNGNQGRVFYNDDITEEQIKKITDVSKQWFDTVEEWEKLILLFKGNQIIEIRSDIELLKLEVPFIIYNIGYDSLNSKVRRKIYRFNQKMINLSKLINEE
ncbi:hypothetical protein R2F61_02345 [Mollicutes bacterium LVI A0078]|nr:hypothetical protein RZE84_02375 [Mollicutes bacterium LVI A0075]WOO91409.1 hypothetical protein R2F61_02345 [Mollicutes bacterium LVI A0078]